MPTISPHSTVLPPAWAIRRRIARIGAGGQDQGAVDEVVGLPAMAAVVDLVEPAHEQRGARQQDHGQGELAHDEDVAEASMAAIPGHAARSTLERAVEIEPVD